VSVYCVGLTSHYTHVVLGNQREEGTELLGKGGTVGRSHGGENLDGVADDDGLVFRGFEIGKLLQTGLLAFVTLLQDGSDVSQNSLPSC
jgi:hypothetical protein